MGKETKIGLGIILVLFVVFGAIFLRRLGGTNKRPPASVPGSKPMVVDKHASKPKATKDDQVKPTVLTVQDPSKTQHPPVQPGAQKWPLPGPQGKTNPNGGINPNEPRPTNMMPKRAPTVLIDPLGVQPNTKRPHPLGLDEGASRRDS